MPRTGALLSLSRDHHTALVLARVARKAAESADRAACDEVLVRINAHWHQVMAAHFQSEEQLLAIAKDSLDPQVAVRIFSEHAMLQQLIVEPGMLESCERLNRLGELLAAHVRYEERVLFPQLQAVLDTLTAQDPAQEN